MRRATWLSMALMILAGGARAEAMPATEHQLLSLKSCVRAGLPRPFCARVGVEAANTAASDDPALHARRASETQPACDAANVSAERLRVLGGEMRRRAVELRNGGNDPSALSISLGRALHVVQDACAGALGCAEAETDQILPLFATMIEDRGLDLERLAQVSSVSPAQAAYAAPHLEERWAGALAAARLRQQLVHSLATSDERLLGDVCGGNGEALAIVGDSGPDASAGGAFRAALPALAASAGLALVLGAFALVMTRRRRQAAWRASWSSSSSLA